MICYNCGAALGQPDRCPDCGADVRIYKKIVMASNASYNEALKKARVRDLSGAILNLKESLRFYKMNIDARNLLGLVYYDMGEVVMALTEWVLSKNYQPRDNAASRYLDEVQKNQGQLETINQTIKKYNQALQYCRQDSRDLAIIQLKKVLSMNPRLVSGHQLLALLYLQEGKYEQAKKCLRNAGRIDSNNTTTLRYLAEVNQMLRGSGSGKKQKDDELLSYQSGNETIIQPRYRRESSALGTVINMIIGLAIGVAVTYYLVVPGVRRQVLNEKKTEVIDANNAIASKNQTISELEAQIEDLTVQITNAKGNEENYESRISTYEQLFAAYAAYANEDIEAAGTALGNVNEEYLSEESKRIYDAVNAEVNAEYVTAVNKAGRDAYDAQDYEEAIKNLSIVVELDETYDSGYSLFYLAQAYRKNEDQEHAAVYFQKVVELYPGTERAGVAQNYIDSIEEE